MVFVLVSVKVIEIYKESKMNIRSTEGFGDVGLGAWQLGSDWGNLDDDQAQEILKTAASSGINFIDTADVYGGGLSEKRIGTFLATQDDPSSFFVATKIGRLHGYPDQYSLELFRRCVNDSCTRLGVEQLDLVQLHCVPTAVLREGTVFDWLRILKEEGKIRHFGASVESTEEAKICLKQEGLFSLQVIFNIFRQDPISTIFDEAQSKNVALIVRLPLASGLLSGRFHLKTTFPEDDHRHYNRDGAAFNVGETFAGLPFETAISLTQSLKEHIASEELPMASLALRWILDHPAISVVIPGATNVGQVLQNAQASVLSPLPAELHKSLREFFFSSVQSHIRGPV
jgi:aryl-alcohol dehydrogenase-like predicted oxidoreductase